MGGGGEEKKLTKKVGVPKGGRQRTGRDDHPGEVRRKENWTAIGLEGFPMGKGLEKGGSGGWLIGVFYAGGKFWGQSVC